MPKHKDTNFCDSWFRNIQEIRGKLYILCNKKVIDIQNSGILALVSHKTINKKHQEKERDLNSSSIVFFKNTAVMVNQQRDEKAVNKPVSNNSPQANSPISSVKLPKLMVEDADLRWALKVLLSHFSYDMCVDTDKLLSLCF